MQSTAQFETVTVSKAKQLLLNNKSNRPINESNLKIIEAEMKRKNFELTGESIKVASDGTLIDGQHRLLAIVNTGEEQKMLVVRGLDKEAFKYIDTGRKRTAGDVLGIQGIKNHTQVAAMASFVINFSRGKYSNVAERHKSARFSFISNADISEFVTKNLESIKDSYPFGYNKQNKLLPGGMLASLHFIFKKINRECADDFCWKLAGGESLTKESPIYLLRQKLTNDIRSTRKMKKLEKLALICKAWNLYRSNKKITMLKWDIVREPFPKPM